MLAPEIDPALRLQIERLRVAQAKLKPLALWMLAVIGLALTSRFILYIPYLEYVAVAVAAYGFYLSYRTREAYFTCPHCKADTTPVTKWVCGKCSKEHSWFTAFFNHSFLQECKRCGQTASAFVCPSCRATIEYDKNTYPRYFAFVPECPPILVPEPEPMPPTLDDLIPFKERQLHTMIVGSTGSGKSEAIKQFVHSLLSQPVAAIVIDPHGDMAEQIAQWPNDRLIYVAHNLQKGYTPTINPFEIYGIEATDISPNALAIKKVIAQQLLAAFQEVTAGGERSEITKNMQTILMPCLLTLLGLQGATIRDLQRFMDDNRNMELVKFGSSRHHYPDVSEFFKHNFHNKAHLRLSKDAVFTKLQDLLTTGFFSDLTCAKSTFSLEQAWDDRKVVVFNLGVGKIGERESAAFGRLLVCMLQGIALRRADIEQSQRIPCHVFIDEAYMFVSPSIEKSMRQSRKYGLILTLAAQQIGQMSKELENTIRDSAHVQIVGVTKPPNYKATATMFHLTTGDIAELSTGKFLARVGNNRPIEITIPNELVGTKGAMLPHEWDRVQAEQIKDYYRPTAVPVETPTPPAFA